MSPDLNLSPTQSILLSTDGTVTDLIRHFTGEDIHVTKLSQQIVEDDKPDELELSRTHQLLQRQILLSGPTRHYLYAESFFVIERMSDYLRQQLLESDVPIGLLWQQEKLETFREILDHRLEQNETLREHFPTIGNNEFLSRRYRIYHGGMVLGLITEKFPYAFFR